MQNSHFGIRSRETAMKWQNQKSRYLFLLPALVVYLAVIVFPAISSLYYSLFKWNGIGPKKFVGLKNYIQLFTSDSKFRAALVNNLLWLLMTVTITVGLALLFALLINKKFRGRTLLRGVLYFPYILSGIVVGIIWRWIYDPTLGLVNSVLLVLGKEEWAFSWLSNPKTALVAVFAAACWMYVGSPMVLFLAGLQSIPSELSEAARIDGANRFQVFWNITIPLLKETFVIVFATQIVNSLKVYDLIYTMTAGGPANATTTLALYMTKQTFSYGNVGMGAAVSMVMVIIMMVVIIPYVSFTAKR